MDMTSMGENPAYNDTDNMGYTNTSSAVSGAAKTNTGAVAGYSSKAQNSTQSSSVLGLSGNADNSMENSGSVLGATAKANSYMADNSAVLGAATKSNGSTQSSSVVFGAATKANGTTYNNSAVMGTTATAENNAAVLGESAAEPQECICDDVESYVKSSVQASTCDLLADSCINPECFGSSSQQYADCLLEFIYDEYVGCQSYCALANRVPSSYARRVFRCLAESERRHSNRFVTAYFLITGKRFCPARNDFDATVSTSQSYCETLRQLYFEESCDAAKYRTFAGKVTDPCLKKLALELAEDEKRHAQQIMDLIRRICTCGRRCD